MKKIVAGLLALTLLLLSACGNGTNNSKTSIISNGAYNMTPQEYIDKINENVELQNDSRYLTVPPFEKSGDKLQIDFIYCDLTLTTDENNNITKIHYTWDGTRRDIGYSIGMFCAVTFDTLSPGNIDAIHAELDMMNVSSKNYETSATSNGSTFEYRMMSQFNYLTIYPTPVNEE